MRNLLIFCIAIPALLAQKPGGMAGVGGGGSAAPSGVAAGDLSGTYPNPTVVNINGTALSGLATGLLKNTTTTGVPSIAVAGTDLIGGVGNLTTVGSVPYVSASGILNQDAGQFFWDATNNRLGIGNNSPATAIDLQTGTITASLALYNNSASVRASTGVSILAWDGAFTQVNGGSTNGNISLYPRGTGYVAVGSNAPASGYKLDVTSSTTSGTARFYDQTASTGVTTAIVRAGANQSTTDLNQWQANDGTTILTRVTSGGKVSSTLFGSETNCSSSAAPAVCAAAAAGSVIIPAAGTDVTVNTTAVTANSQIFAIFDQSLGTKLGVTCNSTTANPHIGARVAGTSFTIHANVSPVTNPACFSYFIIN